MYEPCKPKVQVNILGSLKPGKFSKCGHCGQDQISMIFFHETDVSIGVLDRTKCPPRKSSYGIMCYSCTLPFSRDDLASEGGCYTK